MPIRPASAPDLQLASMRPFQRQTYFGGKAGMQWLMRFNQPNGRFLYGYVPALATPLLENNYTHQAAATYALARASRVYKDKQATALARQALLTLLLETRVEGSNPGVRRPAFAGNTLAASGWLVMAIYALPEPGKDLLDQAEQLCQFIRQHQEKSGAFSLLPGGKVVGKHSHDTDCGSALVGLALGQKIRPADWKLTSLRNACAFYHADWKKRKRANMIPLQSVAYSQAFLLTKENGFRDCVLEMNDWLCSRQYQQLNNQRLMWYGGFQTDQANSLPDVHSAKFVESLAHACLIVRETGDLKRYQNYRRHIERGLEFLGNLQYTQANTQQFAERYHSEILGAFHGSHQDGNIRIDYIQEAVCAYMQYLASVDPLGS